VKLRVCKSGEVFFNNQFGGLLFCRSVLLLFYLLAGRGGKLADAFCIDGRGWGYHGIVTA
jgi:hypothetical protein